MTNSQLHNDILRLLKRHVRPAQVATLLRSLHKAATAERKLLGEKASGLSLTNRATLDQVITFCMTILEPTDVAVVVMELGDLYRDQGDLLRTEELYTLAIALGEEGGDRTVVGAAHLRRGDLHSRQGRWKESTADLNLSRRIFTKLRNRQGVGKVENIAGTNFAILGKMDKARKSYTLALAAFEKSEELFMTGTVLMNLGIVSNILGAYDIALDYYRKAESYFTRTGSIHRLMELHHNTGMSYYFKESYADAMRQFDVCIGYATKLNNVNTLATASLGKAAACHREADHKLALALANRALHFYTMCNDRGGIADTYKVKGMIHRDQKEYAVAQLLFHTSIRLNAELDNQLNSGEAYFELGLLEEQRKDRAAALKALATALSHFESVGAAKEMQRTRQEITKLRSSAIRIKHIASAA